MDSFCKNVLVVLWITVSFNRSSPIAYRQPDEIELTKGWKSTLLQATRAPWQSRRSVLACCLVHWHRDFPAPAVLLSRATPDILTTMSSARYARLPTSPSEEDIQLIGDIDQDADAERAPHRLPLYPPNSRFYQPTPPAWARAGLIVFIIFCFWLSYAIRGMHPPPDKEAWI